MGVEPTTLRLRVSCSTNWLRCAFSAGLKVRKRRIVNEPTEGPESCPHLEEAVPCDDPACYRWQLVRLDPCLPGEEKTCGPGTRFTHVKCVNSSGELTQFTATSCHTGIWGKCFWIEISFHLNLHFKQLFWISKDINERFDQLLNEMKCTFKYTYCVISFHSFLSETCKCLFVGQGEEVGRSMCSSSPDPGPVLCEVPCSRDCVLSDWTSWSTCSQTCSSKTTEGKQMRMRSILAYNAGEGVSTAVKFSL